MYLDRCKRIGCIAGMGLTLWKPAWSTNEHRGLCREERLHVMSHSKGAEAVMALTPLVLTSSRTRVITAWFWEERYRPPILCAFIWIIPDTRLGRLGEVTTGSPWFIACSPKVTYIRLHPTPHPCLNSPMLWDHAGQVHVIQGADR